MTVTRQSYTETTRQLWRTALWCSTDSEGQPLDSEHDIQDVDPEDVFRLEADYWQFRDRADEILLKHGQGDACLEDFWPTRVEHLFVLCREGHGSGFTDDYLTASRRTPSRRSWSESPVAIRRSMRRQSTARCSVTGRNDRPSLLQKPGLIGRVFYCQLIWA